jgi:uncharacterized protein (DUF305 family)
MKISYPLSIAFILIALVIGMGIGFASSPPYPATMESEQAMGLGTSDRWVDLRYINAMIRHHRGAMLLAEVAKKESKRPEIHGLSIAILENEPKLIDELYSWKRAWYNDSRRVTDPTIPNLATYDEKFDLRLLNALIAHHEAGIAMTSEIRMKSSNKDVLNNADAVELFLTDSTATLKNWRAAWYQLP